MLTSQSESEERALSTLHYTMGPEVLGYMEDPNVFEIIVNPDGTLWIDTFKKGRIFTGSYVNAADSRQLVFQVASMTNQVCTDEMPMLAAELPDGSRFQGFLPKVVTAPSYIIRKHSQQVFSLADYVNQGVMSRAQEQMILRAIADKKNIVAAGGTKSGKTTFLNAILAEISKYDDRIVMIEDLPELRCTAQNYLSLRTTDKVTQDDLLKSTLRATPDRIVVGEVRSGEALALLDAWSTGHGGGCSTVHSNSAKQTLYRLQQMVSRVSITPQQVTIAEAVDIVIYIKRKGTGRIIEEVIAVDGFDEEKKDYITHQIA